MAKCAVMVMVVAPILQGVSAVLRHTTAITVLGVYHAHTHTTQGTHCGDHRCCNTYDDAHTHTDTCTCAMHGMALWCLLLWLLYILVTYRSVLASLITHTYRGEACT